MQINKKPLKAESGEFEGVVSGVLYWGMKVGYFTGS